jgi:uncharacterized membrane protein
VKKNIKSFKEKKAFIIEFWGNWIIVVLVFALFILSIFLFTSAWIALALAGLAIRQAYRDFATGHQLQSQIEKRAKLISGLVWLILMILCVEFATQIQFAISQWWQIFTSS